MEHRESFFMAKYHLSVAERMLKNYRSFPDKRTFLGILSETHKGVLSLIKSYLIYEGSENDFHSFKRIGEKYLDAETCSNLLKVPEIWKSYKNSPVDYQRNNMVIIIEGERYRVLTFERLENLTASLKKGILDFPE